MTAQATHDPLPHRAVLTLLLLASMLGVMAGSAITPVLEIIREALAIDGTKAGLILTAHGLVIAVISPLAGWFIDRYGVRLPLVGGLLLYGLAGSAGMYIDSYWPLIISRLIFGIAVAFVFTGTTVAMLAIYHGNVRNRVMGWRTTATSVGGIFFPILGGGLASSFSWNATFGLYAVGVPLGLIGLALMPDIQNKRLSRQTGNQATIVLFKQPVLLGIFLLVVVQAIMLYALAIFLPLRLGQLGLKTPLLVSGYMALMSGMSSVVGIVYGRLSQRFGYLDMLRFTALAWAVSFLILGLSEHLLVLAVASAVLGIGNALAFSTTSVLLDEYTAVPLLGRATAIFSTCMFLGQFVSPLLLGPVMAMTSISTGYLVLSASSIVILIILFIIRR